MTDPSQMSDAELMAALRSGDGGGDPSQMSDEQLLSALGMQQQPQLSFGETIAGGATDLLNKATFGAGDEIVAGGNALLDQLPASLGGTGQSLGEAYDSRLNQSRALAKGYEEEHPYASLANNLIALGAPMPGMQLIGETGIGARLFGPSKAALPALFSETKGLGPAVGNIFKGAGLGASYGAASGFLSGEGETRLSGAEEGAKLGATAGGVVQGGVEGIQGATRLIPKAAVNLFSSIPSEDQALLKAFNVSDADAIEMLPVLRRLEEKGVIKLNGDTPFNNIADSAQAQKRDLISKITKGLNEGETVKTEDLFPKRSDIAEGPDLRLSENEVGNALKTERQDILKKALAKLYPNDNYIDKRYADYLSLGRRAKTDPKAAKEFLDLTEKINNVEWKGSDLWQLRQRYDEKAAWGTPEAKGKANVYRALRDTTQQKLLSLNPDVPLDQYFSDVSDLFAAEKYLGKQAGAEVKGKTESSPFGQRVLDFILSPIKSALKESTVVDEKNPLTPLKQLFGETIPQKISDPTFNPIPNSVSDYVTPTITKGLAAKDANFQDSTGQLWTNQNTPLPMEEKKPDPIAQIKADPYYAALAQTESSFDPKAANPDSSAKGLFQFVDATAKSVGLKDPFDVAESFQAVQKLTDENRARFGDDPEMLYKAHYLGATLLNKVLNNKPLSDKEQRLVKDLEETALPNFLKNYERELV